jgi:DNA polymerase-3 subunit gamma/tau
VAKEKVPYLALARKWRPQQFSDVLGQERIITVLTNALKQNRLAHAYLFTGPRGVGKTTLARILAKAANCLKASAPTPTPCDECDSCLQIMAGGDLDVLEIDAASNTGVDNVRELRENAHYTPSRSRFKIYIIDEVHMLSNAAFNALLKTLEEPPPRIKFFFATTEPHKLPATIISRCQRFDLRRIPRHLILERLKKIAQDEGVSCEEEALLTVVTAADGSVRDAESIFDQILVYCDKKVTARDVLDLLGLVPAETLNACARAVASGDGAGLLALVDDVCNRGWSVPQFVSSLVRYFRDLLVVSLAAKPEETTDLSPEALAAARTLASSFTRPQLSFILDELIALEGSIKNALSERVALEMSLLKLARSRERVAIEDLVKKCGDLERSLAAGSADGSSARPSPAAAPPAAARILTSPPSGSSLPDDDPPPPADGESAPVGLERVRKIWPDFMETLAREKPMLKSYLHEGRLKEFANGVLTICFDPEYAFQRESLDSPNKIVFLENLLKNKLGSPVKIKLVVVSGAQPADCPRDSGEPPSGTTKKKFIKGNPMVKAAIEMFDATVVDIKE